MTLMIILGGAAAIYALLLLFRCATYALPVFAGIAAGLHLHASGYGWAGPVLVGIVVAILVRETGRLLMDAVIPAPLRIFILLAFVGSAAAAGYQVGNALAGLAGLGAPWQIGLAALAALITASRCWFDLMSDGEVPATRATGS